MYERQQALAAEIRAESAAQRITQKEIQRRIGISSSAWDNYFGKRIIRDVPLGVVEAVAEVLELDILDLMTRARARWEASGSPSVDRTTDEIEAGMNEHSRRVLREQRERFGVPGDVADPSGRTRADVDDGVIRSAMHGRRTA